MDCILGYHLQPFTCGIARFNHALGEKLAIPVVSLFSEEANECRHALLSIKLSEFTDKDTGRLEAFIASRDATQTIDLFLHDYSDTPTERRLIALASRIYVGNAQMARILGPRHPRVIEAWCPGTLIDAHAFPQTEISVFSFGMAHKMRAERYYRLRELLEATGKSYGIYLSTALHEGTDFAGSFMTAFEEMTEIFGQRVNFLGFLSDAAVFNYLNSCTYFTAFFPQGGAREQHQRANGDAMRIGRDQQSGRGFAAGIPARRQHSGHRQARRPSHGRKRSRQAGRSGKTGRFDLRMGSAGRTHPQPHRNTRELIRQSDSDSPGMWNGAPVAMPSHMASRPADVPGRNCPIPTPVTVNMRGPAHFSIIGKGIMRRKKKWYA